MEKQDVNFMNDKSKTKKTAFGIPKQEFQQMLEEQKRPKPQKRLKAKL